MKTFAVAIAALASLAAQALAGSAGRLEINQALINANGGFPYSVAIPGSYVLTSDLSPPAATPALLVAAAGVNIDLNGFRIHGSATCTPNQCQSTGAGGAILAAAVPASAGVRGSVRNGEISGIDGPAVVLRDEARIEDLSVSNVTGDGIQVGSNGMVRGNRVTGVGGAALLLGAGTAYSQNVLANAGLGIPGAPTVQGGVSAGLNVCDDGRCGGGGRLLGFSSATMNGGQGIFTMVAACNADFPGTRVCTTGDLVRTAAVPPGLVGEAWVRPEPLGASTSFDGPTGLSGNGVASFSCYGWTSIEPSIGAGMVVNAQGGFRTGGSAAGVPFLNCAELRSVACCTAP